MANITLAHTSPRRSSVCVQGPLCSDCTQVAHHSGPKESLCTLVTLSHLAAARLVDPAAGVGGTQAGL